MAQKDESGILRKSLGCQLRKVFPAERTEGTKSCQDAVPLGSHWKISGRGVLGPVRQGSQSAAQRNHWKERKLESGRSAIEVKESEGEPHIGGPCVCNCYLKSGFASGWVQSQKTQSSQRAEEGRIYQLQQMRRPPGIFPEAVSPRESEEFLS